MKTIMAARSPHESSFSFSRRHFQKIIEKVVNKEHGEEEEEEEEETKQITSGADASYNHHHKKKEKKKKKNTTDHDSSLSKFKSAIVAAIVGRSRRPSRVCGTLFGYRRGHVHLAFQPDPKSAPTLLIELAMPTATLVREMASGLVRIALECDRATARRSLVEEVHWRAYCNGKKCGFAERRACGAEESRVLKAVEPVTMGAGVLPGGGGGGGGGTHAHLGEMMYMRARFERVVGSRDSEAFYMMNPDGNSGPEFSLYLLRV
ncbi:protein MIZU-KUSSEI 1 [Iris pallida]|uniref:Protein MIZU-KUSSEI 1 n=1 Tax=Iris pallida TaxID=29817 RepID=A0AAX6EAB1_IRIPA|nr:protein MIZU-KUSSEI 1 [Iris pallida]